MSKADKYNKELEAKHNKLRVLLSNYYKQHIDIYPSDIEHFRMRAEFRIWHDGDDSYHIMFDQQNKTKYKVDRLLSASSTINLAMSNIISLIHGNELLRSKLYQIDYLSSLSNELVVSMIYHKKLDETWESEANNLASAMTRADTKISIIGRSKGQKVVIGQDYVIEKLRIKDRVFSYKQQENSFTQPNAEINIKMIEWVIDNTKELPNDLLELYCGSGNFSIPLTKYYNHVVGTEISKSSVSAAQYNIQTNNIDNLDIVRLSSEEFVQAMNKERKFNRLNGLNLDKFNFSSVLVDPPRAGLDQKTIDMIKKFDNIIYISCNPNTLSNNLEALTETHKIKRAALFDQFPFTEHIESGVILAKE